MPDLVLNSAFYHWFHGMDIDGLKSSESLMNLIFLEIFFGEVLSDFC